MNAPSTAWTKRTTLDWLRITAQKSVMTARRTVSLPTVSETTSKPTGACCQELATMIQMAEKIEPSATMSVAKKCMRGDTRSQPNTSTARKPDSRKKAKMPSAARAEPKMSPT